MPRNSWQIRPQAFWPALACLLATALFPLAALAAGRPEPPRSVVVMQDTKLQPLAGGPGQPLQPGRCLDLITAGPQALLVEVGKDGDPLAGTILAQPRRVLGVDVALFSPEAGFGPWWIPVELLRRPAGDLKPGAKAQALVRLLGRVPLADLALLPGPAQAHLSRLARLARSNLPPAVKKRLMRGLITQGDSLWHVEMAWGLPQRSFMVNLINDEQHFIYLKRGPRPIILRFKAGMLVPPLPDRGVAPQDGEK